LAGADWAEAVGAGLGPVHGPISKKGPPEQRRASWRRDRDKGYWIHRYVYSNYLLGLLWDALGGVAVKVDPGWGNIINRYKTPFPPNDLGIVYSWQQDGVLRWIVMRAAHKPASFRWTFWKLNAVNPVVICQPTKRPGNERFCQMTLPDLPETFDCWTDFDAACAAVGTEYFPDPSELKASAKGNMDSAGAIPAVTEWGMAVMALLVLAAATVVIRRARALRVQA
jgi:hypothetical protein